MTPYGSAFRHHAGLPAIDAAIAAETTVRDRAIRLIAALTTLKAQRERQIVAGEWPQRIDQNEACPICNGNISHAVGCGAAELKPVKGAVWLALAKGLYTLVDEADAKTVEQFNWRSSASGHTFYAYRTVLNDLGRHRSQFLHTFLTGNTLTDHINGHGLDNRRGNLREATASQNGANMRKVRGRSRFKGVIWISNRNRWRAQITVNGRRLFLGHFAIEEDAGFAYDDAARREFGEFAALNFPASGERSALDRNAQ